jgi:hypothetical protein
MSIFDVDGRLKTTEAEVLAWTANYLSTPGFALSDGEIASELLGGKLDK